MADRITPPFSEASARQMVQNAEDMVNCPHLEARHMWTEIEDPVAGKFIVSSNPVKMSRVEEKPVLRPPLLGEHNEEVLGGLVGLTPT